MNHFNTKPLLLATALSAVLLAGCGGGGGGPATGPEVPNPTPEVTLSVDQMLAFIRNLVDNVGGNGEQVDVNAITLTTDDTASPADI